MTLERRSPLKRTGRLRQKRLDPGERERREEVRRIVFDRDRGTCQLRGVDGAGECFGGPTYHHRRKDGRGGSYTIENGAVLCAGHNDRLEADADLAALGRTLGLVVRLGDPEWDRLGR